VYRCILFYTKVWATFFEDEFASLTKCLYVCMHVFIILLIEECLYMHVYSTYICENEGGRWTVLGGWKYEKVAMKEDLGMLSVTQSHSFDSRKNETASEMKRYGSILLAEWFSFFLQSLRTFWWWSAALVEVVVSSFLLLLSFFCTNLLSLL